MNFSDKSWVLICNRRDYFYFGGFFYYWWCDGGFYRML